MYKINFNDLPSEAVVDAALPDSTRYTSGSFQITGESLYRLGSLDDAWTGSVSLFEGQASGTDTLSRTDGKAFSLTSIDLYQLNLDYEAVSVTFTGKTSGGGTVTQTATLSAWATGLQTFYFNNSFSSVTSVSWTQAYPYYQYDNIVVDTANTAPVVASYLSDRTVTEGTAFSFQLSASSFTDVDGDSLSYSARLASGATWPSWLTFNSSTRTFSGTAPDDSPTYTIRVTASDGQGGSVSDDFVLNTEAAQQQDGTYKITFNNLPSEAVVDAALPDSTRYTSGSFQITGESLYRLGSLDDAWTGSVSLFEGQDGGMDTLSRTDGRAFRLTSIDLYQLNLEYEAVSVTFTGRTSGGGTVTQTATLSASATGFQTFYFNNSFSKVTSVSWTQNYPYYQYDNIVVGTANTLPVVAHSLSDRTAIEGAAFSVQFPANSFTDADGDSLSYSARLANGAAWPSWLTFNSRTRTLSGTAPEDSPTYTIRITASDGQGGSVFDDFVLNTETPEQEDGTYKISFNDLPSEAVVDAALPDSTRYTIGSFQITGTSLYRLGSADDAWTGSVSLFEGQAGGADTLSRRDGKAFSLSSIDLYHLNLDYESISVTFTGRTSKGTTVTQTAVVSGSATGLQTFRFGSNFSNVTSVSWSQVYPYYQYDNIVVGKANTAPVVASSLSNHTITEGTDFSFQLPANSFTDADGDSLSYSARLANGAAWPSWLTFNGNTQTFSGTVPTGSPAYTIRVIANDGQGGIAFDDFVLNTNAWPRVATPLPDHTVTKGTAFSFQIPANSFTDTDGDSLSYSARLANGAAWPSWLTFNGSTRTLSGTVPAGSPAYTIRVIANDGQGGIAFDDFVLDTNASPRVAASLSNRTVTEGSAFSFQIPANSFTDADGDSLSYSARLANGATWPSWLTFNASTRTFSGTAPAGSPAYTVRVIANDGQGGIAFDDFVLDTQAVSASNLITMRNIGGNHTSEGGGTTTYNISLNNPLLTGSITIKLTTLDSTEGKFLVNGREESTQEIIFDKSKRDATITIKGIQDYSPDGHCSYVIQAQAVAGTTPPASAVGSWASAIRTFNGGVGSSSFHTETLYNDPDLTSTGEDRDIALYLVGDSGGARDDNLVGNDGPDRLYGQFMPDFLDGGIGDDRLYGGYDDDQLYGGIGNDLLYGEQDDDYLNGGDGNDTLDGGLGIDTMVGGIGSDTYYIDDARDVINDQGNKTDVDTVIITQTIRYTLPSNVENASLSSDSGNSGLIGNQLGNTLTGNDGNNLLDGGAGNDTLSGGAGSDTLYGGAGNDTYVVDSAGDRITDSSGVDTVRESLSVYTLGSGVEKLIYTGSGKSVGSGNILDNEITTGIGNDTLNGGAGNDKLNGGAGDDILIGGAGNDTLNGGAGHDTLTGGVGADIFKIAALGEAGDRITDFVSKSDKLQFVGSNFGHLTPDQLMHGRFISNATGAASGTGAQFIFNTKTRTLFFDSNGVGSGGTATIATLSSNTLLATDVLIVAS